VACCHGYHEVIELLVRHYDACVEAVDEVSLTLVDVKYAVLTFLFIGW
jgi:hypothetical protein